MIPTDPAPWMGGSFRQTLSDPHGSILAIYEGEWAQ